MRVSLSYLDLLLISVDWQRQIRPPALGQNIVHIVIRCLSHPTFEFRISDSSLSILEF